jgi:hypothetical protein
VTGPDGHGEDGPGTQAGDPRKRIACGRCGQRDRNGLDQVTDAGSGAKGRLRSYARPEPLDWAPAPGVTCLRRYYLVAPSNAKTG